MKMDNKKVVRIISLIIFLLGIICIGIVFYYVLWQNWYYYGWDHLYTTLLVIGIPLVIIGTIMVNKYLRAS